MYHDYYDIIHGDYDYDLDIGVVDDYCKIHNLNYLNLLEVGCGTGKHTALLSKHFKSIFAIDIDPQMIERAKEHILRLGITNVLFFHRSALELQKIGINLCGIACSFFNVINYVLDFDSLVQFFCGIASSLSSSGTFIFDCLDASKKYEEKASFFLTYHVDNKKAIRNIESIYNTNNQTLHVNESYSGLFDESCSFHERTYKLWNREQIEQAATLAGFNPVSCSKKTNINSKYRKQNQVLFFMKKE